MNSSSDKFWKNKLIAWLHDPPGKAFDIPGHKLVAESLLRTFGLSAQDLSVTTSDRTAAAADRFPFPKSSYLIAPFTGEGDHAFRHPFGGGPLHLKDAKPFETTNKLEEEVNKAFTGEWRGADTWREKFLLLWRRWPEQAAEHDPRLAFLPADTRIPDHSIWNHNSVVSALQGCVDESGLKPAFLLFQAGPVQSFIAEARSTRDLWSGSFLLSWLVANAIQAIAKQVGPDAFLFPSLRGQPLFDALNRDLWQKIKVGEDSLWDRMYPEAKPSSAQRLTAPTLPNRFLCVVPADHAESLARAAESAYRAELRLIAEEVWESFDKMAQEVGHPLTHLDRKRFFAQIELWPEIAWQVYPWSTNPDAALKRWQALPDKEGHTNLQKIFDLAFEKIPKDHRDSRCEESKGGLAWAAHYAMADFFLAARRNTRDFAPYQTDPQQSGSRKDPLTGREEVIGTKDLWTSLRTQKGTLFKNETDGLGALSLLKRLWCRSEVGCLKQRLGLTHRQVIEELTFDGLDEIARKNTDKDNPYVALLALDGDEMGKWISGTKTPTLRHVFARESVAYFESIGQGAELDRLHRPLSPSYHLQFSEALSVFATRIVDPIVRAYGGQLILAGGDDVLAMLPASKALDCAAMLRAAFRGESPKSLLEIGRFKDALPNMKLPFDSWEDLDHGWLLEDGGNKGIPRAMPGPNADVSVGIAVAHFQHPLQHLVAAAQAAEKIAKTSLERAACQVRLLKRSGEELSWGFKWESGALALYHRFSELTEAGSISAQFPYALAARFAPLGLLQEDPHLEPGFVQVLPELLRREFAEVLERQAAELGKEEQQELKERFIKQLENLDAAKARNLIHLFLASAFMNRQRGDR